MRPISPDEAGAAVEAALERFNELLVEDAGDVEGGQLFIQPEPDAEDIEATTATVDAAWVLGPTVAGNYDDRTEVRVWLQVSSGVTAEGYRSLGERMTDMEVYAMSRVRPVRAQVSASPPSAREPTIEVELEQR